MCQSVHSSELGNVAVANHTEHPKKKCDINCKNKMLCKAVAKSRNGSENSTSGGQTKLSVNN